MVCSPPVSSVHRSPGKNSGVGCHFLLQVGIKLILLARLQTALGQGLNPHLTAISHLFESENESVSSSVQFHPWVISDSLQPHGLQHARLPCLSPTPKAYINSCPSSRWCHSTISSYVILFSSGLQSFPESESFQISQFFTSGGQSIGVSASASVLPMNFRTDFL